MVLEQIVVILADLGPSLIYVPLLVVELEILAPAWAIFHVLAHLIFVLALGEIYGLGSNLGNIDLSFCF